MHLFASVFFVGGVGTFGGAGLRFQCPEIRDALGAARNKPAAAKADGGSARIDSYCASRVLACLGQPAAIFRLKA